MEWKDFKKDPPCIADFIVAYRDPFPSFYWMGVYKGVPNEEEDMFTHWFPLPLPKEIGCRMEEILNTNEAL